MALIEQPHSGQACWFLAASGDMVGTVSFEEARLTERGIFFEVVEQLVASNAEEFRCLLVRGVLGAAGLANSPDLVVLRPDSKIITFCHGLELANEPIVSGTLHVFNGVAALADKVEVGIDAALEMADLADHELFEVAVVTEKI